MREIQINCSHTVVSFVIRCAALRRESKTDGCYFLHISYISIALHALSTYYVCWMDSQKISSLVAVVGVVSWPWTEGEGGPSSSHLKIPRLVLLNLLISMV